MLKQISKFNERSDFKSAGDEERHSGGDYAEGRCGYFWATAPGQQLELINFAVCVRVFDGFSSRPELHALRLILFA